MNLEYWRNYVDEIEATPLETLLGKASAPIRATLERSRAKKELTPEEGLGLYTAVGDDLRAMIKCADLARAEDVGDEVTYVVNRNINFTNICFVGCQFCGFKRQRWESDAYDHSDEKIIEKMADAVARGATEVCMQGGINPDMPPFKYRDLLVAMKGAFPEIHIHAFSPMEIMYGAKRVRMDYPEYIAMLRDHGLGSIPGTAAEILDDGVREILSHKKVDVAAWVEIITTAHSLGVPTTSTVMYGHVESPLHVVNHLDLLRTIQKETHGFTEFVPLRFIHQNTVLFRKGLVSPVERGQLDFQMYAFSRLFLRGQIDNLQTSWVKCGIDLAALTLKAGCNDFSGTLMEESITAQAGGDSGEFIPVDVFEDKAREMGRVAVERTTLYQKLYGKKAPNGARPIASPPLAADHHASGGSGCS
ncbi:MAG: 5-amino-6-(D-ribitylamino)uracil--L-tyrosine 4-hydroxyphenyl transferase CofH [Candidatus Binatus sp.]|uniref:5-amino-6-(D-ribitylamino)uracil--L-tyrosine 4-hydroxyphenyl transferase CofH n=1 Tax=Candidatus Binatus sp. TaxID=2811406 RepID=UPI0027221AD4|nr:5-amino-6-(D-ribitylamino)uracil--L-tyrosine 4-hydroxyphenyl transferase CofH [Candidatus Binatus sp.]MDO8433929.1 5-amino-6-(D-ribitylamino)uracil--L-tyrosine 4-hydroxyphenyl transferase CofH [Candidatus Binatus sp.]